MHFLLRKGTKTALKPMLGLELYYDSILSVFISYNSYFHEKALCLQYNRLCVAQ